MEVNTEKTSKVKSGVVVRFDLKFDGVANPKTQEFLGLVQVYPG